MAGAFGEVGTLIPFVVAYITIVKVEPLGLLFMFGVALAVSGLYCRTPLPIQPMKAIGAGGVAGHVRFGAKTGGALVILGSILVLLAPFSVIPWPFFFKIFPNAILGVILFFAGSELAIVVRDIGDKKTDFYVMLIVTAFAMWNMGVAFLAGIVLDTPLQRGWLKI